MKFTKKITIALFSTVFAISALDLITPLAFAEQTANINQITNIRRKSVVLEVQTSGLENKIGVVNVEIKNNSTGKTRKRNYNARFDGENKGRVRIRGLKPGTEYTFRVRVEPVGGQYGPFSSEKTAKTQG